jgi:hypothetical protein
MIECLLLSVGEPQLERCLNSIRMQTVPFDKVIHVENVVPQAKAYNQGLSQLSSDWFLLTAGDICLFPDAVIKVTEILDKIGKEEKVFGHSFKVYDSFFGNRQRIGVFRTDILKMVPLRDKLSNDTRMGEQLFKMGFYMARQQPCIGSHFDNPDDFQAFSRFYICGLKYRAHKTEKIYNKLKVCFEKTGNHTYLTAMKAMEYAGKKREYPGSHNIEFDRKNYEEFLNAVQAPQASP